MSSPLAVRIDKELRERLDQLATATNRPLSYLTSEALKQYLDANEWQVQATLEGIKAADEGRLVDHDTLTKRWEERRAAAYAGVVESSSGRTRVDCF